jgi:hypothetical protein
VGLHLLKAFVSGSICYGILLLMWGVANMETLMDSIHTMDLWQFVVGIVLRYLAFLGIYLLCVFAYAQTTYTRAKREVKKYSRHLKRVIGSFNEDGGDT